MGTNKFTYEDLKKNPPSEKIQALHRAALYEMNMARFKKQAEHINLIRKERAPYRKALIDFFKKEKVFNLRPFPKRDPKGFKQKLSELKGPNFKRLKKPIFHVGSFNVFDIPENLPFQGWVDNPPPMTPSNNAGGNGGFDGKDTITMDLTAGVGYGNSSNWWQEGGSAAMWGYVGSYYSLSDLVPETQEAMFIFEALPSGSYYTDWNATLDPFDPFWPSPLQITMEVNLIALPYDNNGNPLPGPWPISPPVTIDQEFYFEGSSNEPTGGFQWGPIPLVNVFPLSSPIVNYGFFVQFYMFVSADGQSTGSWVSGNDIIAANLSGTVPWLNLEAMWNS
jgi:hypothetical protein